MRQILLLLIILTISNAQKREALLIGNSNYKYISKLNNPLDDLQRLKKTLEMLGFTVNIKTNLNSENLEESIELFQVRLGRDRDTIGFLYYTGHGCQVDHQGYLIPTDIKTSQRLKVKHHALKINEMIEKLKDANNKVNMLFLDACRDVSVGKKGSSKGLGQIKNTPEGTLVMYATKAGETANDNNDFINSIIKSIQEPKQSIRNLPYSISDIFKHNRTTQKPIFSASDIPKIILNGNKETLNISKPTIKPKLIVKPTPIKKYSLTIATIPSSAKVYITNITPKYKNGIMLEKGKYTIKIKKDGYKTEEFEVELAKDFNQKVVLKKKLPENIIKTIKYDDGVYTGKLKNNLPFGKGTYIYNDGRKYIGMFNGSKNRGWHGYGVATFPSVGSKYMGMWKNDKRHGKGTQIYADGYKYVGMWKNDKRHGKGTQIHANGDKYIGMFKNNKKDGKGTYFYMNGDKYIGMFKNNTRNGSGEYIYSNGNRKKGVWESDVFIYFE